MARTYAEEAKAAGDQLVYLEFEDGDHFTVITPSSDEWDLTVEAITRLLA
jgi:hypothetical protein